MFQKESRGDVMAWFISDTHFNHTNIIKYCNRPFENTEEMNNYIVKQWNKTVGKNDIVYHLGDFALPNSKEMITNLVNQLNGSIILILGNHDRRGKQWFLDCGFVEVYKKLKIVNYLLTHKPQMIDKLQENVINIHGHVHGNDEELDKKRYINVSCEIVDYTPIWIDLI